MRCWLYAAVSSNPQESTLDDQRAWGESVAGANGWTIVRTFSGVSSGAQGPRELLESLLVELRACPKAERPARVLMIRLDRVGRQALDCIAAVAEIKRLGVTLHTREDGDLKLNAAMDALRPIFALVTAQMENEARSDKWKAVHARRRAAGLHVGVVPFGVVLVEGKAVPYEPEASVVRELFERSAQGWGYARLARWARERSPTKRQRDGSDKPMAWAPSTVKSLLDGKTTRALVADADLVRRADAARQSDFRTRAPKRWPWPLAGAVRCTCGKLLAGHASGDPRWPIRYYICQWHPGEGSYPSHRADALEAAFYAILKRLTAHPALFFRRRASRNVAALKAQEAAARKRLETLDHRRRRACELAEDGSLSGPQLRERLDEIDAARTAARAELERVQIEAGEAARAEAENVSLRELLEGIEARWAAAADVAMQQDVARTVAALVDGLIADPAARGELRLGAKVR